MRAIRLEEPRRVTHVEIADPGQPGPGQALVKTHRMGICGTDYSGFLGKMPFYSYPRIPGHELGVEVLAVGSEVTNVSPGNRCSVEPYLNCKTCFACRQGRSNCCQSNQTLGVMVDGGLCEKFLIRADKLHVSRQLDYEQLALVETLAIGCHACDRGNPQRGQHALIIGAGPIGLAALEFVRLTGAQITVMDMVASRLEFCQRTYNVQHTLQPQSAESDLDFMRHATNGDMYAVVIDATGSDISMSQAVNYVAHTGVLVYVGITSKEVKFPHPALHRREMEIRGARNALPRDFGRIIKLIEEGVIDTRPWITHRTSYAGVPDALANLSQPDSGVIKAVVDVAAG